MSVDHTTERSCTGHFHTDSVEAEMVIDPNSLVFIVLRCPICDRPRGLRLIRKTDPRHPNNQPKDQP